MKRYEISRNKKPTTSVGFRDFNLSFDFNNADRTGLEPATSAVTGRHSNQLNYRSIFSNGIANIVSF